MSSCLFIFFQQLPTISFSSQFDSSSSSLHFLSNSPASIFLPTKTSTSLSFLHLSQSLKSFSLPNSLIFFKGTQVQEDLLRDFWRWIQPHLLEWGCKTKQVSSTNLQAIQSCFRECKGWIGQFSKLFSFLSFALGLHFNLFLDMQMLGQAHYNTWIIMYEGCRYHILSTFDLHAKS